MNKTQRNKARNILVHSVVILNQATINPVTQSHYVSLYIIYKVAEKNYVSNANVTRKRKLKQSKQVNTIL